MGMLAWSFSARTVDEVALLLRALGKHRYVREVDHRIHWAVDAALSEHPAFCDHASAFEALKRRDPELDPASRDPRLWRQATIDDVVLALAAFWTPGADADRWAARLQRAIESTGLPPATHAPFESNPEDPPHPELLLLDWVLLPVDELDTERHAGAFAAMEDSGDEVDPSAPLLQEGPVIAMPELIEGAANGLLVTDFIVWSEEPYSYADYVFRGASKSAKLVDPPVGIRDL